MPRQFFHRNPPMLRLLALVAGALAVSASQEQCSVGADGVKTCANSPNVLIVGASRGIGLALAEEYAAAGATVFATVRGKSSAAALLALGPSVTVIEGVDLAEDGAPGVITAALGSQTIDIAILNAAVFYPGGFADLATSADKYRQTFQVNVLSQLRVAQAIVASGSMKEGGKIGFITSRGGSIASVKLYAPLFPADGSASYHAYSVSKAALNMGAALVAEDLRPKGIAVATIHPGVVETDMLRTSDILHDLFLSWIVDTKTSATKIMGVFEGLTMTNTGTYIDAITGEIVPW